MESKCENCLIRQLNALKSLSKDELKKVSQAKELKRVKKGENVFSEGDKLSGIYCVRSGVSKMTKLSSNGKDQIVKLVKTGETLGKRSVIADETVNLNSKAVSDMELCYIPRELIHQLMHENPQFKFDILGRIAREIKKSDDLIVNMSQKTVKQRLAHTLLYIDKKFGVDAEGYLSLKLSRDEYANIIGTSIESVIRMISDFKKQGLIATKGKRIGIMDNKVLYGIVEGFR